ncbi:hypothetical protein [Vogesella sp. EB]|uniref:hypothetical protein n=1 Tax=Vogesella sp. EB TaxID=1526735 RepID=UPI0012DFEAA0|nr:hypothetical protein [Vogesella sp. EB]
MSPITATKFRLSIHIFPQLALEIYYQSKLELAHLHLGGEIGILRQQMDKHHIAVVVCGHVADVSLRGVSQ